MVYKDVLSTSVLSIPYKKIVMLFELAKNNQIVD